MNLERPVQELLPGESEMKPNVIQYWEQRKNLVYYHVLKVMTTDISRRSSSMIDVGSNGCPYLDWFPHITHRTSIDLSAPYIAEGIKSLRGDFLSWKPDRKYDVVTCFQVLEHVPPVEEFAKKLLSIGRVAVVSVPYRWPAGRTKGHVNDPVDELKLLKWFGRPPNYQYLCREVMTSLSRLVQVYDRIDEPWNCLNERNTILLARSQATIKSAINSPSKT
jgi:hypothetical protein